MIDLIDAANRASLGLHDAFGFRQVGYLPSVGYKFVYWMDTVMVQRPLGRGGTEPPTA
jgi:L-amino acid N-acyltransferase YncA